jgi:transposase-like protein
LKPANGSWRVDETCVQVKGKWACLYRAVDSTGATIDYAPGHPRPRVIRVDGNPSYPKVVAELKQERSLGRRCRTCLYLNNIVEQDHRAIKRRINARQGFRSFHGARRTIEGCEVMHTIRKGQVRWAACLPPGNED